MTSSITQIKRLVFLGVQTQVSRRQQSTPEQRLKLTRRYLAFCALALAALVVGPELAAASSTGSGLPWETPLTTLTTSINGPVAFAVALLGLIGVGANLMWGGEMGEFLRKSIYAICAIAFLTGATTVLSKVFNVGAVIVGVSA